MIGSFFSNAYWFSRFQFWQVRNQIDVATTHPDFLPCFRAVKKEYLSCSPFDLVQSYFRDKEEGNSIYGETPFCTLVGLAQECDLSPKDAVLDLGCGRGLGLFFLRYLTGCKGKGVDLVPFFIETAQAISKSFYNIEFVCHDFLEIDYSQATCIYLYGTCLSNEQIYALIGKLRLLDPSVQIVTVSYPLTDYSPDFQVHKMWKGAFPWGSTNLYLQTPIT